MKFKSKLLGTALAAAFVAPALLSGAAAKDKFNQGQIEGYVGKLSQSQVSQATYDTVCVNIGATPRLISAYDRVVFWEKNLLREIACDHTFDGNGVRPFTQGGPTRASRALAMTSITVYDALNAFGKPYKPYNNIGRVNAKRADRRAAVSQAAHDILVELFPAGQSRLDALLADDLAQNRARPRRKAAGRAVGAAAARAMIARRASDRSDDPEPQFGQGGRVAGGGTTNFYGDAVNDANVTLFEWTPDPNTPAASPDATLSLGAYWGDVEPFVIQDGAQFRLPPPPAPGSTRFNAAFDEVSSIGGSPDNQNTTSTGTPATQFIGNFWGYDAVPLLGVPPREFNQIAVHVWGKWGQKNALELSRYLARLNAVIADAGIGSWDSKWYYQYWRPVTGVRTDDGVAETNNDATWDPFGVSVINTDDGVRVTPPFPAYPSGHATFSGAAFSIMRATFGDNRKFTWVSDEYNGAGFDPVTQTTRPLVPVRFDNFSAAQFDCGISRIYNGVHWEYDNTRGQEMGMNIADYLMNVSPEFK